MKKFLMGMTMFMWFVYGSWTPKDLQAFLNKLPKGTDFKVVVDHTEGQQNLYPCYLVIYDSPTEVK